MTTTNPTAALKDLGVDVDAFQTAGSQARALGEKFTESAKTAGLASLNAYEQAVQTLLELEEKAAAGVPVEGMSALASAHVSVIKDITAAYLTTARGMLN